MNNSDIQKIENKINELKLIEEHHNLHFQKIENKINKLKSIEEYCNSNIQKIENKINELKSIEEHHNSNIQEFKNQNLNDDMVLIGYIREANRLKEYKSYFTPIYVKKSINNFDFSELFKGKVHTEITFIFSNLKYLNNIDTLELYYMQLINHIIMPNKIINLRNCIKFSKEIGLNYIEIDSTLIEFKKLCDELEIKLLLQGSLIDFNQTIQFIKPN